MIAGVDAGLVESAALQAQRAAVRSGVRLAELSTVAELERVCDLYAEIWRFDPKRPLISLEFLRALAKAGNYLVGAFDGDVMLGACVGFFGTPVGGGELHSHMAGVSAAAQGRNVGFALKVHQRAWALDRGIASVYWTVDPLVRRNIHFNLVKLGAEPVEYLTNFYGHMTDEINRGDESDRISLRWRLDAATVAAACDGVSQRADPVALGAIPVLARRGDHPEAREARGDVLSVAVPEDIERVRASSPQLATRWRLAVREHLGGLLGAGHRVIGFDDEVGYLLASQTRGEA